MGQEITTSRFTEEDFGRFQERLEQETRILADWFAEGTFSRHGPVAGFEVEAWLLDQDMRPAPCNQAFLERMGEPLVTPELALFNIELNNRPQLLIGQALSALERDVAAIWARATGVAHAINVHLMTIGILPTLRESELRPRYMSPLRRYQALNQQVLRSRQGRPLRLDIVGRQKLSSEHSDVMLEAATTSFQIHLQVPVDQAHLCYNAAIAASAPMVAACANSPFLFGLDLWDETRIPLFEQSVEVGGYGGAAHGPLRRVSFGSGYARESLLECFQENLNHFPVLLPMVSASPPEALAHLRLHNGTIWRWNRPLIGFDEDGTPHLRIEHRVLPGSPSVKDAIANAALFYGLAQGLCMPAKELRRRLPFSQAKDNFYQAARFGLDAQIAWLDGARSPIKALILDELLPLSHQGLNQLGVESAQAHRYLEISRRRVACGQNGCAWQRGYIERHGPDMQALTQAYLIHQQSGDPVHEWTL